MEPGVLLRVVKLALGQNLSSHIVLSLQQLKVGFLVLVDLLRLLLLASSVLLLKELLVSL